VIRNKHNEFVMRGVESSILKMFRDDETLIPDASYQQTIGCFTLKKLKTADLTTRDYISTWGLQSKQNLFFFFAEKHATGVFDHFLDFYKESNRFATVDDAVIVA